MSRLEAMQIFVRVAELASFTRAAADRNLPKASVSQAVQQLEGSLGTRLLHRTTRKVELTQDGRAYYERCRDLLADLDELHSMFEQSNRCADDFASICRPAWRAISSFRLCRNSSRSIRILNWSCRRRTVTSI